MTMTAGTTVISSGIGEDLLNSDAFGGNRGLSAELRRDALKNMQEIGDEAGTYTAADSAIKTVVSREAGVVVIVPTGHRSSSDRVVQTQMSLRSISEQISRGFRFPVGVLIADNGLSREHRDRIGTTARQLGLNFRFVDAPASSPDEHNSQFALNAAVRELKGLSNDPASSRVWRADAVALLDDDAAFGPFCLRTMYETLSHAKRAVAVEGAGRATPDITADYDSIVAETQLPPDVETILGAARRMPSLWRDGRVDLASIVAFSGDVTIKTACLLLQRLALEKLTQHGNEAFVRYPHGSFGDMALGASLSRHGDIYQNPLADFIEQKSGKTSRIFEQKLRWGRDHVHALNDFVELGAVEPGIHVLEPLWRNGSYVWRQWTIPDRNVTGVVVFPRQVARIADFLEKMAEPGNQPPIEDAAFGAEQLNLGLSAVRAILAKVEEERKKEGQSSFETREDLPCPWRNVPPHRRWTADALASQLAGNLAGMREIQELKADTIPDRFVIGVRQYARWMREPF